jgi:hypothetical protein
MAANYRDKRGPSAATPEQSPQFFTSIQTHLLVATTFNKFYILPE